MGSTEETFYVLETCVGQGNWAKVIVGRIEEPAEGWVALVSNNTASPVELAQRIGPLPAVALTVHAMISSIAVATVMVTNLAGETLVSIDIDQTSIATSMKALLFEEIRKRGHTQNVQLMLPD